MDAPRSSPKHDEQTRSRSKAPPPAFEDRVTVDPHPPGVDRDHAHELPDAPDDGPEAESQDGDG